MLILEPFLSRLNAGLAAEVVPALGGGDVEAATGAGLDDVVVVVVGVVVGTVDAVVSTLVAGDEDAASWVESSVVVGVSSWVSVLSRK